MTKSNEEIVFGPKEARISPYVFIFDGWDEISTGATQGFKDDIDRLLTEIRTYLIDSRGYRPLIRVIITGRPSVDVTKTRLLRDNTPILTIRPFDPQQLENFIAQVLTARQSQPLISPVSEGQDTSDTKSEAPASGGILNHSENEKTGLRDVLKEYSKGFNYMKQAHAKGDVQSQPTGSMAVLGMPLLAMLALRLMLDIESLEQLQYLIKTPTTLYRALVDMTYEKGGKLKIADINSGHRYRIAGEDLRILLWYTAEAITATGSESISREELKLRLRWDDEQLERIVNNTTKENVLAGLIIGFFFKEGTEEQGCEFMHKSFREYLFAEGIIGLLKQYGCDERVEKAYRENGGFPERDVYWEDFEDEENLPPVSVRDPRYDLTHRLAEVFATSWPTPEVKEHLKQLLIWEIGRADGKTVDSWPGEPTNPISIDQWKFICDGLADVWDWWAEGVLLRPKPRISKDFGTPRFTQPFIVELAQLCSPRNPASWKGRTLPDVVRVTTIDSRLDEAFYHLTAVIHAELFMDGLKRMGKNVFDVYEFKFDQTKRYQRTIRRDEVVLARFAPSGEDPRYFRNFIARINSVGWRLEGQFPSHMFGRFLFLQETKLSFSDFGFADLEGADLRNCELMGVNFSGASFKKANLTGAQFDKSSLDRAHNLHDVVFSPK